MLLAELTLDLGTVANTFKVLLGVGLLAVAVLSVLVPLIQSASTAKPTVASAAISKLKPTLKRRDVDRSSDTPPPAGFADHLRIIEVAAPNANPAVWWEYAKAEMTEAEVALAEAKLARQPDPVKV